MRRLDVRQGVGISGSQKAAEIGLGAELEQENGVNATVALMAKGHRIVAPMAKGHRTVRTQFRMTKNRAKMA